MRKQKKASSWLRLLGRRWEGRGRKRKGEKLLKAGSKVLEVLFSITFKAFYYGKTT